jgi:hypothetical protein
MMNARKGDESPDGVILYFEGLDCAGKSSTGNLIRDALSGAGYELDMVQYNRPPTEEQKRKPWMDRFQLPVASKSKEDASYQDVEGQGSDGAISKTVPGKAALIWDRGERYLMYFLAQQHLCWHCHNKIFLIFVLLFRSPFISNFRPGG